jgi:hypothetical protein
MVSLLEVQREENVFLDYYEGLPHTTWEKTKFSNVEGAWGSGFLI